MRYLADFVNGSVDGLITTFAIVAGTIGANLPLKTILILGLANVIADAFSIGASRYLAVKTEREQGYSKKNPKISALIVFLSFIAIGFLPITAYFYSQNRKELYIASILTTAVCLYFIGYLKGIAMKKKTVKEQIVMGFETLLIGGIAGLAAFLVGKGISHLT